MGNVNKNKLSPQKKLAELIKSCIKYGSDADGKITKTKLAKLVYLSDFAFFYKNLVPITGVIYNKLEKGPVALDYFYELISLVGNHIVNLQNKGNAELFSLNKVDEEIMLDENELGLVKTVCKKWKNKRTEEIVKFTHEQLPWKISFENDVVPYSLIIQEDETKLF